jgi:predicted nucleic acid-binding protein
MTVYFWDSSALIKRYITEVGTPWVRSVIIPSTGNTAIIAQITSVELASALARRIREGSTPQRTARAAQHLIERHIRREYTVIALTEDVVKQALDLVYQHPLRAYDAVQLASAVETNQRMVAANLPPLEFVSGDHRLLTVAQSVGLQTVNPANQP